MSSPIFLEIKSHLTNLEQELKTNLYEENNDLKVLEKLKDQAKFYEYILNASTLNIFNKDNQKVIKTYLTEWKEQIKQKSNNPISNLYSITLKEYEAAIKIKSNFDLAYNYFEKIIDDYLYSGNLTNNSKKDNPLLKPCLLEKEINYYEYFEIKEFLEIKKIIDLYTNNNINIKMDINFSLMEEINNERSELETKIINKMQNQMLKILKPKMEITNPRHIEILKEDKVNNYYYKKLLSLQEEEKYYNYYSENEEILLAKLKQDLKHKKLITKLNHGEDIIPSESANNIYEIIRINKAIEILKDQKKLIENHKDVLQLIKIYETLKVNDSISKINEIDQEQLNFQTNQNKNLQTRKKLEDALKQLPNLPLYESKKDEINKELKKIKKLLDNKDNPTSMGILKKQKYIDSLENSWHVLMEYCDQINYKKFKNEPNKNIIKKFEHFYSLLQEEINTFNQQNETLEKEAKSYLKNIPFTNVTINSLTKYSNVLEASFYKAIINSKNIIKKNSK